MSKKENKKTRENENKKKETKIIKYSLISGGIIALIGFFIWGAMGNTNKPQESTQQTETEIKTDNSETPNKSDGITITEIENDSPYFEYVNTNYVDDRTYFVETKEKNENGGNYKVITNINELNDFIKEYDLKDIDTNEFSQSYFEHFFLICIIDTFEENYQNREFYNFEIYEGQISINYNKISDEDTIETKSGYWVYLFGVEYDMVGETEIKKLPIDVNIDFFN